MFLRGVIAANLLGIALGAHAQEYPTKAVRIVAASVGASADYFARLIAPRLSETWGKPVIVDNRGGAAASIAATTVVRSTPDGYTLLMGETNSLSNVLNLFEKPPYDPRKDLVPITLVAKAPLVVVAHPSLPVASLRELLALAKKRPRALSYASAGQGTVSHTTTALLVQLTGIDVVHVPYRGAGAGTLAIVAGETPFGAIAASAAMPQIRAGKVKALAQTGRDRFPMLPDVPTGSEAGVAGFESVVWFAMAAPAGTPAALVTKLNSDVVAILKTKATQEAALAQGAQTSPTSPDELRLYMQSETTRWARVIKGAGVKME